jgi:hypothetical protein
MPYIPLFVSMGTKGFNSPKYLKSDRSVTPSIADIRRLLRKDPLCANRICNKSATRCLLDLLLIPKSYSATEITKFEGEVFCIIGQVF